VSTRTIYNWAQTNYIPSFKLGKSWRFKKSEITEWMNSNRTHIPSIDFEVSNYNMKSSKRPFFPETLDVQSPIKASSDTSPLEELYKSDNNMPLYSREESEKFEINSADKIESQGVSRMREFVRKEFEEEWIELKNLYLKEKLSIKEIAKELNKSEEAIRYRLKMNFVYLRDEYYSAKPNLDDINQKKCPTCQSKVRIMTSRTKKNPNRQFYSCQGAVDCWVGWVDDSADKNKNPINEEETKINLFTNHIEIEMSKRPDGVLSFEVFEQDYSQDTINEGLKRLEPFGYKLQETQVTKHKFITRG